MYNLCIVTGIVRDVSGLLVNEAKIAESDHPVI